MFILNDFCLVFLVVGLQPVNLCCSLSTRGQLEGDVTATFELLNSVWPFHPDPVGCLVKCGLASLHSVSREKQGVLYQLVEGGVVQKHHRGQVVLPVQGCLADVGRQVLGDHFVGHLCLAATLGMVGSGGGVGDLEKLKEIFG